MKRSANNLIGYVFGEQLRVFYNANWGFLNHSYKESVLDSAYTIKEAVNGVQQRGELCNGEPKPTTPPDNGYEWSCGINGWFQAQVGAGDEG